MAISGMASLRGVTDFSPAAACRPLPHDESDSNSRRSSRRSMATSLADW